MTRERPISASALRSRPTQRTEEVQMRDLDVRPNRAHLRSSSKMPAGREKNDRRFSLFLLLFFAGYVQRSKHLKHDDVGGVSPNLPGDHLHPVVHGAELLGAVRVQYLIGLLGGTVPYFFGSGRGREKGWNLPLAFSRFVATFFGAGYDETHDRAQKHGSDARHHQALISLLGSFVLFRVFSSTTTPPTPPLALSPLSTHQPLS